MTLAAYAPFVALFGAIINGFFGKRLKEPLPGIIASTTVAIGFTLSIVSFFVLLASKEKSINVHLWQFLQAGKLELAFGFTIDTLSIIMMLVITGVGLLIHIYSIGYMHGDKGYSRYFALLNLFIAAMLILVMADSYPLMFIGWEGVGVCSYLLIGFWYSHKLNADAARKAFIVNRIGDIGFLLAMFLIFKVFSTLNIGDVNSAASNFEMGTVAISIICILFMLAAAGKSAQLPLHTWLPDAMAGPTPVSALIHAATMVTAGVYLIARSGALFAISPLGSAVVAWLGALTALIAAFSAMSQKDIKKILAYSTISQLGYMFAAVGVGAYWVGIFHVFTHAFFKALLFLASGSVIHALDGEQNIEKMGGLKKYLPITNIMALIATLAIAGVPLLAGFFSKDAILSHAFNSTLLDGYGNYVIYFILLITAGLTAFYMFRWYHCVFLGKERFEVKVHALPFIMTIPLVILGFGSVFAGYLGLPEFLSTNWFSGWLEHSTKTTVFRHLPLSAEVMLMLLSTAVVALGLLGAYWVYGKKKGEPAKNFKEGIYKEINNWSASALGIDNLYSRLIIHPSERLAEIFNGVDKNLATGLRQGVVGISKIAKLLRVVQNGFVRSYALIMLIGAVLMMLYLAFSGGAT